MEAISAIAFGPDGKMYNTESDKWGPHVIRHTALPMPGVTGDSFRIPSEDGAEVFEFDEAGRHLRTLDSLTAAALDTFHYDAAGLLATVEDGDGNITTIERAPDGAPLALVGPFGQRTTLETDGNGNLGRVVDPAGNTYQYSSRNDGLLERVTDPRANQFNFAYDSEGRLVRTESAGCCAGELARTSADGATTVAATSPEGRVTTYASETLPTGEVRQRNTFPDGTANLTLTGIDASRATTFADGTVVAEQDGGDPRFGMDAPVLKSQTVRTPGGLARSLAMEQQVLLSDPINPLSLVALTNIAVVNSRTNTVRYDAATRTLTTFSPEGRQTVAMADAQGRPTQIEVPGLETVRLAYDARGRLGRSSQGSRVSSQGYDPATGYLIASTNALGHVTRFEADAAGGVTNLVRSDGTQWGMAQDGNANLLSLTEPNATNVHLFTYTRHNLLETYRSPLGAVETFSYSNDQEPVRRQFPSGQALQWVYETNGHLARLETPSGTNLFTYHATNGLLARAISGDGQHQEFLYDGTLLTNVAWTGPVTGAVSYTYDNDFRVAVMAYADLRLTNRYDGDGLATNLGPVHLTYSPTNGLLSRIAEGAFQIAYERNAFGEITNTVATQDGELYRADCAYDGLGRIARKVETIAGITAAWDYAYDAIGQLVEVKRDGETVEAYAYDALGNRIGMTNTLTGEVLKATDYRYDADHKLLQAGIRTFTYDADGRVQTMRLSGVMTTLHYNADGTLAGVGLPDGRQITYLHDSHGRRVARSADGVRTHAWLYGEALMPLAEYDGVGNLRATFIYGGRWTPVAFIRGGITYHIVTDHLGSPRLVVDASGVVVKRLDYDAFGNVVLDTAPAMNLPFGFAGGMADADHELIRFGARDYQPSSGRWTAKDPVLLEGGFHLYCYVANDPIDRLDQLGLGDFHSSLDALCKVGVCAFRDRDQMSLYDVHVEYNQISNPRSLIIGKELPTVPSGCNQQNIRRTSLEPIRPHF
jgi:RHS repeat-associated protein